jgi:hypothetical protein
MIEKIKKSIFKMAEEDPNFKALLNIEFIDSKPFDYKEVVNQFNYYYNLWENGKLTFKNPDDEEKFLNAVCISRIFAYGKIPEDVRKHGDVILERELKKLKEYKIKGDKMKTFGVFHIFDVDGGFGDAIPKKELICTFNSEEKAKDFIKKYENPHVYDIPYQALECGKLELRELPTTYNEKDFWWLSEEYEECDEEDEE